MNNPQHTNLRRAGSAPRVDSSWNDPSGPPVGLSPFVNLQKRTKAYNCETPFVDLQNLQKPTKTYNYEHKNVTKVHKNVTKVTITSRKARNAAGGPAALRYSIFFLLYFFLLYRIFFYCTVFFSTVLYFFLLYCIFFYKSYNYEQESSAAATKLSTKATIASRKATIASRLPYNCEQKIYKKIYNCEPQNLQRGTGLLLTHQRKDLATKRRRRQDAIRTWGARCS